MMESKSTGVFCASATPRGVRDAAPSGGGQPAGRPSCRLPGAVRSDVAPDHVDDQAVVDPVRVRETLPPARSGGEVVLDHEPVALGPAPPLAVPAADGDHLGVEEAVEDRL